MKDTDPDTLLDWHRGGGRLCFLTGAGISAESGIPTFRGSDGFWTIGSRNYSPMELATHAMFTREPAAIWCWYLARIDACRGAVPNAAHLAIAELQARFPDRVALITQNVDGLHARAGSPEASTFAIHGDARFVRCSGDCTKVRIPTPEFELHEAQGALGERLRTALTCRACGAWMRPHVLWFDECYHEELYRAESATDAAVTSSLLVVVGTTGATSLPAQLGLQCARLGIPIVDVNPEPTLFSVLAAKRGLVLREAATTAVPRLVQALGHPV